MLWQPHLLLLLLQATFTYFKRTSKLIKICLPSSLSLSLTLSFPLSHTPTFKLYLCECVCVCVCVWGGGGGGGGVDILFKALLASCHLNGQSCSTGRYPHQTHLEALASTRLLTAPLQSNDHVYLCPWGGRGAFR